LWAKNRGLRRLYLHCLVENQNMTHLSRALGLTVSNECGENQGVLELEPATPMAVLRELTEEAAAVCDYTLKATRAFQSLSMIQYAA
jgi:hypothetical protein